MSPTEENSTNGWLEYRRLVLAQLESNTQCITDLEKAIQEMDKSHELALQELRSSQDHMLRELRKDLVTDEGVPLCTLASQNAKRISALEIRSGLLGLAAGSLPMLVAAIIWWIAQQT